MLGLTLSFRDLSLKYVSVRERRDRLRQCVIHRDSSRGCCTVRRRGWRSLVSCCTPRFNESTIWSFSNFWYLSIIFLSNTNTATSWNIKHKQLSSMEVSSWLAVAAWRVNHLFGWFLGAIIDPPAHARAPAGNMSANFKLTRHRVPHDSAGDVCSHLGNSALQLVQHGLHDEAWLCSRGLSDSQLWTKDKQR